MNEYDALLREAEELQEGWRGVDDGTAEARLICCIADLAAALRASEARAEAAEKRERAYREALKDAQESEGGTATMCEAPDCPNPATEFPISPRRLGRLLPRTRTRGWRVMRSLLACAWCA